MIQISNLTFGYRRNPLFTDLSLTLTPGKLYGLLGVNGAGKSTLLRLMAGLLFPKAGSVQTLGREARRREPSLLSQIFLLPDKLNLPPLLDHEYVEARAPFYPDFDIQLMRQYLSDLQVPLGKSMRDLSHGQQKRFALAFGLACNTRVVILDEPTNGLDIPTRSLFRRVIAGALREDRVFVVSTHQVQDVAPLIDTLVILHTGQVLLNHAINEIVARVRMSRGTVAPASAPDLLYAEPSPEGHRALWHGGDGGHLDLELLFSWAVTQPQECRALFQTIASRRQETADV